jgi:hypothetical protein
MLAGGGREVEPEGVQASGKFPEMASRGDNYSGVPGSDRIADESGQPVEQGAVFGVELDDVRIGGVFEAIHEWGRAERRGGSLGCAHRWRLGPF